MEINGVTTGYTTNNLNLYTAVGQTVYTYDASGNMITETTGGVTTNYTYDDDNRLVAVSDPVGTWAYEYDALGNRVASTRNGQTTRHVFDSVDQIAEYDGAGLLLTHYAHGLGLVSQTGASGQARFYDHEANGNVVGLTDPTGAYANKYSYLPFGNSLSSSETVANPFKFVGQWGVVSGSPGLNFMRNRDYDPNHGRFVQADPIGAAADLNLYRYADNDPISFSDPSGLYTAIQRRFIELGLRHAFIVKARYTPSQATNILRLLNTGAKQAFLTMRGYNTNAILRIGQVFSTPKPPLTLPPGSVASFFSPSAQVTLPRAAATVTRIGAGTWIAGTTFAAAAGWATGSIINTFVLSQETRDGIGDFLVNSCDSLGIGSFCDFIFGASENVRSTDPNNKLGSGFGTAHYVDSVDVIPYRINFENLRDATAPAQIVTVTDQLSADLDWDTFEVTEVGFGDILIAVPDNTQLYETTVPITASSGVDILVDVIVGIRLLTGEVFATFISLDPDTGLPPDVLTGFLPPEDDTGRGQGYFSYTIKLRPGLNSGTEIRNIADITFDFGTTIATNQVDPQDPSQGTDPAKEALVTIDAGDPTSSVTELPAAAVSNDFMVDWSGQDDACGSGVASYDIFVSENGGAFTPWLLGTTETSGEFTGGVVGTTYGFFSIARDNVGHVEPMPTVADTQTRVQLGAMLDVTGSGNANPFQDGILIVRFMLDQPDANLEDPALIPAGSTRTTGAEIRAFMEAAGNALDANGDGIINPFQDGILIVRFLLGQPDANLEGPALIPAGSTRTTGAAIRQYLLTLLPPDGFAKPYYDVALDGKISALDALRVINQIARLNSGLGEASGKNADPLVLPVLQQPDSASPWSLDSADPFADLSDSDSRSTVAKLTGFDSLESPSTNFDTVRNPGIAARSIVNAISDELESTLRTLADDVAQRWAVG
jgi:RHS repeat-associated protein